MYLERALPDLEILSEKVSAMAASIDRCPACQGPLSVDASLVGGRITCPHCSRSFRVAK